MITCWVRGICDVKKALMIRGEIIPHSLNEVWLPTFILDFQPRTGVPKPCPRNKIWPSVLPVSDPCSFLEARTAATLLPLPLKDEGRGGSTSSLCEKVFMN